MKTLGMLGLAIGATGRALRIIGIAYVLLRIAL